MGNDDDRSTVHIKDYVDALILQMQGEMDRRIATILRENAQRWIDHLEVHSREREVVTAFKSETTAWRQAENQFRSQLTEERSDYVQRRELGDMNLYLKRKELWGWLAACGATITLLITVVYFIVYVVRGGK